MKCKIVTLLIFTILFSSCSFINLSDLIIKTEPSERDSIIVETDIVSISFSDDVEKFSTEQVLTISFNDEKINVDFEWQSKKEVRLKPEEKLIAGRRYFLNIEGIITLSDSRIFQKDIFVPFYYETDSNIPKIIDYLPLADSKVGINQSISITFSHAVDQESFNDSFSISPFCEYDVSWDNTNTIVTINPTEKWSTLSRYTWSVSSDLVSQDSIKTLKKYDSSFLVQLDTLPPQIVSIQPGDFNNGTPIILPAALSEIRYSDGVYFTFSEPVNPESFETSLKFSPDVDGLFTIIDQENIFFMPESGWDLQRDYNLEISTELEDINGNKLRDPYYKDFKPGAIPPMNLVTLEGNGSSATTINTFNKYIPEQISITPEVNQQYWITLNFSENYSTSESRLRIQNSIRFSGYYNIGSEPVISNIIWTNDQRVTFTYVNMEISTSANPDDRCVYKFSINGGVSTINGNGSYIPEEIFIFLESN